MFLVMASMRGTKNFVKLQEGVLIIDKTGLNAEHLSSTFIWVFLKPYKTPKMEPFDLSFL